jgi:hypothetical protein
MPKPDKLVRIGGASGFWGDSRVGAPQLVRSGRIDYLVFDYLAETTMAILAAARRKNPELGYATDFVDVVMKEVLPDVMRQGIKVVANAGGINPHGCADALCRIAQGLGLAPRIAIVEGDDVSALLPELRQAGLRDMFTNEALPERALSASAYLGALPIARALDAGADIVIAGRCVDSAVTLGPLMHEFGWAEDDYHRLAGGSLAGHIIECGCQATGGLYTDWQQVPDWPGIGYPIVECAADGSFTLTKPAGTGGLIARAAVAEQLLYEIGDPGAYVLPDVVCDFRNVQIEQLDEQHVHVGGARGSAPTNRYKVSSTVLDGHRCAGTLIIIGIDAAAKAQRTGEAILARTRQIFRAQGLPDYTATRVEVIGAETMYGPHARAGAAREVMLRVVVNHASKDALDIFAREIAPSGTSWSPGTTMPGGGRPPVSPLIRQVAFLIDKHRLRPCVMIDRQRDAVDVPLPGGTVPLADGAEPPAWPDDAEPTVEVPLVKLAWARSGDKGNLSNIGVIARRPEWLPLLWRALTPPTVRAYFAHLVQGEVARYWLPGIAAINLVLEDALDGGGPASMRMDPLGKGMAQMLLDLPVRVPRSVVQALQR